MTSGDTHTYTLAYLEGETDKNSNLLLCLAYRIILHKHTHKHMQCAQYFVNISIKGIQKI